MVMVMLAMGMMIMIGMAMVTMVMIIVMMVMVMMMVMTHCSKLSRSLATWGSKSQAPWLTGANSSKGLLASLQQSFGRWVRRCQIPPPPRWRP